MAETTRIQKANAIHLAITAAIGLSLLVASPALMPRSHELGLMHYKDKEFRKALIIFEEEYAKGARDSTILVPLARLKIQNGDVVGAIKLMEHVLMLRPNDPIALHEIGQLYQFAQRPSDYTHTLEKLRKIQPTEKVLRELSQIYNFSGSYDQEVDILREMLKKGWAKGEDIKGLAYLLAARGDTEEALIILEQQIQSTLDTENISLDAAFLRLNLLIDTSPSAKILGFIQAWRATASKEDADINPILDTFETRGRFDLALAMLRDEAKKGPLSIELLQRQGVNMTNTLQFADAYNLLKPLQKSGRLGREGLNAFISSAVHIHHLADAIEALSKAPLMVNTDTFFTVIDEALAVNAQSEITIALKYLPKEARGIQPVLMARTYHALENKALTDYWIARAETSNLGARENLDLIDFQIQLKRPAALSRLLNIVKDPTLSSEYLLRAAGIFLHIGKGREGQSALRKQVDLRKGDLAAAAALAFVSSTDPKSVPLQTWLSSPSGITAPESLLRIGYSAASDTDNWPAAVAFSQALYKRDANVNTLALMLNAAINTKNQQLVNHLITQSDISDPLTAERISHLLIDGDFARVALHIIQPWDKDLETHPGLLMAWARASLQAGDPAKVFARLKKADFTETYAQTARQLTTEAAIATEQWDYILSMSNAHLRELPEAAQIGIIESAIFAQRLDDTLHLITSLGWELLDRHPLVGAEYALLDDDMELAIPLIEEAAKKPFQTPTEMLRLGRLWLQIGHEDKALAVLEKTSTYPHLSPSNFPEMARLYYRLGEGDRGLKFIQNHRSKDEDRDVTEAWAVLATAAGHKKEITRWLTSETFTTQDRLLLRDLYFTASETQHYDIALNMADKLWSISKTDSDRLILARANLESGHIATALKIESDITLDTEAAQDFHLTLLTAAVKAGLADKAPLVAILAEKLKTAEPIYAKQLIFDLQSFGAYDEILPRLAQSTDPQLQAVYIDTLQLAGKTDELERAIKRIAFNRDTPIEERRNLAFRMLTAGQKQIAEDILTDIADETGPYAANIEDLRYLWGPRATPRNLEWLQGQAQSSSGKVQAGWLRLLANFGGADRAAKIIEVLRTQSRLTQPTLLAAAQIYNQTSNLRGLRRAINDALRTKLGAKDLRDLMIMARDRQFPDLAKSIGETLVKQHQAKPDTLRIIGSMAYLREDYDAALDYLKGYLDGIPEGDFETNFYMGEIYGRRNNPLVAANYYSKAIKQIESLANPGFFPKHLRGLIFQRLERYDEAIIVFQDLLKEAPNNNGLRSDLAETLLLRRDSGRARDILFSGGLQ